MKKFWMAFILMAGMLCLPNAEAMVKQLTLPCDSSTNVTVIHPAGELIPDHICLPPCQTNEIKPDMPILGVSSEYLFSSIDTALNMYDHALDLPVTVIEGRFAPAAHMLSLSFSASDAGFHIHNKHKFNNLKTEYRRVLK